MPFHTIGEARKCPASGGSKVHLTFSVGTRVASARAEFFVCCPQRVESCPKEGQSAEQAVTSSLGRHFTATCQPCLPLHLPRIWMTSTVSPFSSGRTRFMSGPLPSPTFLPFAYTWISDPGT